MTGQPLCHTMTCMGRIERTLLAIGGITPLPYAALWAWERSVVTAQPFLEILSTALLEGFAFGLLAGAAVGQVLRMHNFQQIDGVLVITPKRSLRERGDHG